jgi:hypothetical protein
MSQELQFLAVGAATQSVLTAPNPFRDQPTHPKKLFLGKLQKRGLSVLSLDQVMIVNVEDSR